jgi:hypothetical protein
MTVTLFSSGRRSVQWFVQRAVAVSYHTIVQHPDTAAACRFKKERQERVDQACRPAKKHSEGKAERVFHMLTVTLAHAVQVILKIAFQH